MPVAIMKGTNVVARSQNLRGLVDYARKQGVTCASVTKAGASSSILFVRFGDKARCYVAFASFEVAVRYVRARRTWSLVEVSSDPMHVAWKTAA